MEKADFEKRIAVEKDIERAWEPKNWYAACAARPALGFDESGEFIFFASLIGIKIVNV